MSRREYENKFYKISYVNSDNSSDSSDSRISNAIYCFCVDTDIQLVHTRANKRMKIRLQITSELENDY